MKITLHIGSGDLVYMIGVKRKYDKATRDLALKEKEHSITLVGRKSKEIIF